MAESNFKFDPKTQKRIDELKVKLKKMSKQEVLDHALLLLRRALHAQQNPPPPRGKNPPD
jgi:hypothetical protein